MRGWLSRPQKIFYPICQKALRHLLANSAFRSFGEVTQNFRANRRRPAKAPNVLKISSTALLGARTQIGTSREAWSPPWWTRASSSEHLVWHSDRFLWGNHCLLRYGGHHIKPAFGPGPLSVNQGFLTLEQPDTYHIIHSMVLFLGQKKTFPEIFLLLCTLSPQTKQPIEKNSSGPKILHIHHNQEAD